MIILIWLANLIISMEEHGWVRYRNEKRRER